MLRHIAIYGHLISEIFITLRLSSVAVKSRRAYLLPYFLEMCSKRTSIGASLLVRVLPGEEEPGPFSDNKSIRFRCGKTGVSRNENSIDHILAGEGGHIHRQSGHRFHAILDLQVKTGTVPQIQRLIVEEIDHCVMDQRRPPETVFQVQLFLMKIIKDIETILNANYLGSMANFC